MFLVLNSNSSFLEMKGIFILYHFGVIFSGF